MHLDSLSVDNLLHRVLSSLRALLTLAGILHEGPKDTIVLLTPSWTAANMSGGEAGQERGEGRDWGDGRDWGMGETLGTEETGGMGEAGHMAPFLIPWTLIQRLKLVLEQVGLFQEERAPLLTHVVHGDLIPHQT